MRNPEAKVQVSVGFLAGVWVLLDELKDYRLSPSLVVTCNVLQRHVDEKFAAIERRESFTKYKTAPAGSSNREKHRNAYLDLAGIHTDWRSQKETSL